MKQLIFIFILLSSTLSWSQEFTVDPFTGIPSKEVHSNGVDLSEEYFQELNKEYDIRFESLSVEQMNTLKANKLIYIQQVNQHLLEHEQFLQKPYIDEAVNCYQYLSQDSRRESRIIPEEIGNLLRNSSDSDRVVTQQNHAKSLNFDEAERFVQLGEILSHMSVTQLGDFTRLISAEGTIGVIDVILSDFIVDLLTLKTLDRFDFNEEQLAGWSGIEFYQNPIYRYLGLKLMSGLIEDNEKYFTYLKLFSEEVDPLILDVLIKGYSRVGGDMSKRSLLEITTKAESRGDKETANSARKAVESL